MDKASRDISKSEGYGHFFLIEQVMVMVSVLVVHEAPYIRTGNKQRLEKGIEFSVEPGIYMQNKFGIRIEDIIVIGDNGPEILNKFIKEIILSN